MIDPGLEGKVVLITGANNPRGIGAAAARGFAAQGARVFLHYFRQTAAPDASFYYQQQAKDAGEALAAIRETGATAYAMEGDLADAELVPRLFEEAERRLGPVEVLVNNAAAWEADTFVPPASELSNRLVELWSDRPARLTGASFDRLFAVNTRAAALMMAEFAQRHIGRAADWGRIVNISTAGAERFPSEVSYGASKFAIESYTRGAASELGKFGITVNAISLGPVQTGWITPELESAILPTIPLGRIGTPEEVADAIVFLASRQARWITGQRIYVGGGHGM